MVKAVDPKAGFTCPHRAVTEAAWGIKAAHLKVLHHKI
jgi:hypothetical protein